VVSESKLYEDASRGDEAAFDRLLQRYLPQLHAFVQIRLGSELRGRESSMDVVQSVCRNLLASRKTFDFRGEERFRAWLFTAALNKIRDKHRFHKMAARDVERERPEAVDASVSALAYFFTPSRLAVAEETGAALAAALAALSEEHREVITLARLADLPHRVVAEVMDRSEQAVRQLLGRALLRLTQELRARGVEVRRS
jgi:RNA polymerase sigma-70 factor (ECF subfamily)